MAISRIRESLAYGRRAWWAVVVALLLLAPHAHTAHAAGPSGAWAVTGSLNTARYFHTATLLPNDKVLVAGGEDPSSSLAVASVELYDPTTSTWTATGSMVSARKYHTATLLPSGKVLVSGGYNGAFLASAELYDPATGTWAATGSMNTTRYNHTATLLPSGKVLVADGDGTSGTAELYDPATGTWAFTGSLMTGRLAFTATLLTNGKVLVAGGYGNSGDLVSAELYDPATGAWTATGNMAISRQLQTMTSLTNGKVLVAGGVGNAGKLASAELIDPTSGTWAVTGSMPGARVEGTATLLSGGMVLVAGGDDDSGILASAALYDPVAGTWTTTGSLSSARANASATLLSGGKVLAAGGYKGGAVPLASAELYDLNATAAAPTITTPPASRTVNGGDSTSFTAAASGNPDPTVQWQQSTDNGATFTNISGATATSYSFTAMLSQNGNQYRAVFTNASGSTTTNAVILTVNCVGTRADITSPTGNNINTGTPTFQWGGGTCVAQYYFYAGSSPGQNDVYSAGPLSGSVTSATVSPAIPLDGRTIYVRLWTMINSGYQAVDHSYIMGTCNNPAKADITSPTSAFIATGMPTFQWGGGQCVTQYYLYIGRSSGGSDIYQTGQLPGTVTSATVSPAIPLDGATIYVRLWSLVNGSFQAVDHNYVMSVCNNPAKADITSPTGSTISTSTPTFQWAGGSCVTQYTLTVGSSVGGSDLYSSGPLDRTVTQVTANPAIPVDGRTIYVRLLSLVNGTPQSVDHSYTMSVCQNPHQADLTAPSGGAISIGRPTFQWGGGACVTQYYLYVGNSYGTADLFSSGPLASTVSSVTISPAIPVDGRTIYVRLWSLVNGNWQLVDHSYIMGACQNQGKADITSPTPGTIHGSAQTFSWSGGACVTQYYLYLGSSPGSADLFSSGPLTSSVVTQSVSGLPTNGSTIYLRLWSLVNGGWLAVDHSYATAP